MPRFIHSIIANNQLPAADGIQVFDLPVNPLSCLLIQLAPLNETSTITNFGLIRRLLSALDNVTILHKGAQVFSMNGDDLYALTRLYSKIPAAQANDLNTDNNRRSLTLCVPLARRIYDQDECFPATKRGELQASITWDIADTGFDGLRISLEAVELPGATPKTVQKCTTLAQTFAATGNNDVNLPIGNVLRGILCFGTTAFLGATPAPTLGALSLLVNNLQAYFSSTDFEVSRILAALNGRPCDSWDEHLHTVNAAASTETDSRRQDDVFPLMELYTLLMLDPTGDDLYSLDTQGASAVTLRVNAETADAARFIPIERVDVSAYLSP